jgi:hypothetical protein
VGPSSDGGEGPHRAPGPAGAFRGADQSPGAQQPTGQTSTEVTEGAALSVSRLSLPAPVPAARRRARALGRAAFRLVVHLAVWAPFVTGVAEAERLRWRPVGDGAAIALRSWEVLTAHGPLVGQANRLAHGTFDPGPLQYWLQSIPVHLDPRYGVLWGAALACMIASSLAVEAAWSALGWPGGLLAAGIILGILTWQPLIALQPFWNPWFGAMFFLAALAACWAVLSGRRRWWVVLVVTGSVASQAHLMYALASAALILLALAVTVVDCLRAKAGYGWVTAGLLAGAACWTAPVIQEFTGRPGNLTLLLHGEGRGQLTGLAFGFKMVTASTQPPPLWWTSWHALAGGWVSSLIAHRTTGFAVAALAAAAAVLVIAAPLLRCRRLAALAAVSLLVSAATVVTYARIPVKSTSLTTLNYLDVLAFPVGVLSWLTVCSAVLLAGYQVISRLRPALTGAHGSGPAPADGPVRWPAPAAGVLPRRAVRVAGAAARWSARVAGAAALTVIAVMSSLAVAQQAPAADPQPGSLIGLAAQRIERALPPQPIALWISNDQRPALGQLTLGIVWALTASGYHPELLSHRAARELGPAYLYGGQRIPLATVRVRGTRVAVRVRPFSEQRLSGLGAGPRPPSRAVGTAR